MKRILLLAFLAVSTLAGTTSLSNEAQAAGINGDPEPRIWMCVYKLHSVVRVRNAYAQQVECPFYSGAELAAMELGSQTAHSHKREDDHGCTEVFAFWD